MTENWPAKVLSHFKKNKMRVWLFVFFFKQGKSVITKSFNKHNLSYSSLEVNHHFSKVS